jgi:hypothetical protein
MLQSLRISGQLSQRNSKYKFLDYPNAKSVQSSEKLFHLSLQVKIDTGKTDRRKRQLA